MSRAEDRRPRTRTPPGDVAYVWLRYLRKHGRRPRLLSPERYSEKIQWRKLFDLDPVYTVLSDKLAVRDFVAARAGPELLLPLLWSGEDPDTIPFDRLDRPYVLKTTHANATNLFVDDPAALDRAEARALLRRWLKRNHGIGLVEPGYIAVPPRMMVEPLLRVPDGGPPVDYKFFVFAGRTELIAVRINIDHHRHSTLHVRPDWTPTELKFDTPLYAGPPLIAPPDLPAMIAAAERIAAGFDHLRVDFLHDGRRFWLGEASLYSQSGMVPLTPDAMDHWLGSLWPLPDSRRRAWAALLGRPSR